MSRGVRFAEIGLGLHDAHPERPRSAPHEHLAQEGPGHGLGGLREQVAQAALFSGTGPVVREGDASGGGHAEV